MGYSNSIQCTYMQCSERTSWVLFTSATKFLEMCVFGCSFLGVSACSRKFQRLQALRLWRTSFGVPWCSAPTLLAQPMPQQQGGATWVVVWPRSSWFPCCSIPWWTPAWKQTRHGEWLWLFPLCFLCVAQLPWSSCVGTRPLQSALMSQWLARPRSHLCGTMWRCWRTCALWWWSCSIALALEQSWRWTTSWCLGIKITTDYRLYYIYIYIFINPYTRLQYIHHTVLTCLATFWINRYWNQRTNFMSLWSSVMASRAQACPGYSFQDILPDGSCRCLRLGRSFWLDESLCQVLGRHH